MEFHNNLRLAERKLNKSVGANGYNLCTRCYKWKPRKCFQNQKGTVFKMCEEDRRKKYKIYNQLKTILLQAQNTNIKFKCDICKETYIRTLHNIANNPNFKHKCNRITRAPAAHLC